MPYLAMFGFLTLGTLVLVCTLAEWLTRVAGALP